MTRKIYFFGVVGHVGHFLYDDQLRSAERHIKDELPFRWQMLDGGVCGDRGTQPLGKHYHATINGWTVLSMWDRSVDTRPGSNASFIMDGIIPLRDAVVIAQQAFPQLWARIHPEGK